MNFLLNEEQQLLADSVRRVIDKDYDFEARKAIVASADGWSPSVWRTFAELGLLGLPLSAEHGGFAGTAVDVMSAMEAFGTGLVVEPYVSTVALGGRIVDRAGSDAMRAAVIPGVAEGRLKLALAHGEAGSRYDLAHVATRARRAGGGWVIDGAKAVVKHAPIADRLVVSARTAGATADAAGTSLFLVDAKAAGVAMKTYRTQDGFRAADVTLTGVQVPADALIGAEGDAHAVLEEAVDYASALLCAEAVGAMKFTCDTTLDYLKTRKQFGVPIGAFQALQHRMVDMYISTEQARSMACLVCSRIDGAEPAERRRIVSAARVKIADACRHVGQEAIQLHGGMGMTIELKVSHAFKRLTMLAQEFGDVDHYLERFAAAA